MRTNIGTKNGNPRTDVNRRLSSIESIIKQMPSKAPSSPMQTALVTIAWGSTWLNSAVHGYCCGVLYNGPGAGSSGHVYTVVAIDMSCITSVRPEYFGDSALYDVVLDKIIYDPVRDSYDRYYRVLGHNINNSYGLVGTRAQSLVYESASVVWAADITGTPIMTTIAGVPTHNVLAATALVPGTTYPTAEPWTLLQYAGGVAVPDAGSQKVIFTIRFNVDPSTGNDLSEGQLYTYNSISGTYNAVAGGQIWVLGQACILQFRPSLFGDHIFYTGALYISGAHRITGTRDLYVVTGYDNSIGDDNWYSLAYALAQSLVYSSATLASAGDSSNTPITTAINGTGLQNVLVAAALPGSPTFPSNRPWTQLYYAGGTATPDAGDSSAIFTIRFNFDPSTGDDLCEGQLYTYDSTTDTYNAVTTNGKIWILGQACIATFKPSLFGDDIFYTGVLSESSVTRGTDTRDLYFVTSYNSGGNNNGDDPTDPSIAIANNLCQSVVFAAFSSHSVGQLRNCAATPTVITTKINGVSLPNALLFDTGVFFYVTHASSAILPFCQPVYSGYVAKVNGYDSATVQFSVASGTITYCQGNGYYCAATCQFNPCAFGDTAIYTILIIPSTYGSANSYDVVISGGPSGSGYQFTVPYAGVAQVNVQTTINGTLGYNSVPTNQPTGSSTYQWSQVGYIGRNAVPDSSQIGFTCLVGYGSVSVFSSGLLLTTGVKFEVSTQWASSGYPVDVTVETDIYITNGTTSPTFVSGQSLTTNMTTGAITTGGSVAGIYFTSSSISSSVAQWMTVRY